MKSSKLMVKSVMRIKAGFLIFAAVELGWVVFACAGFIPGFEIPGAVSPGVSGPVAVTGSGFTDPVTGMEFVWLPGGCYQMGDTFGDGYGDEKPVHEVCVDGFYLGKYEVTVGQWQRYISESGYRGEGTNYWKCTGMGQPEFKQGANEPVACVSWQESVAFAAWLSGKTGKGYRLPTEAEWEYAARSGGKKEKYAGGDNVDAVAWYDGNSAGKTHAVGTKQANGSGLYDMSGNVWEWCSDWYADDYYKNSPKSNPQGPSSGSDRVNRGGSWNRDPGNARAANRGRLTPDYRGAFVGFRLALPGQP